MESEIKKNREALLKEIKKLGEGRLNDAVASRLSVYRGAYKALCLVDTEYPEAELGQEKISNWMMELQNEDGTRGPHYTKDQVEQYRRNLGISCDLTELYAATNMMYSDYCRVLKKYGVDRPEVYVELAKAFLDDKDAGVSDKLGAYYEYIMEGK